MTSSENEKYKVNLAHEDYLWEISRAKVEYKTLRNSGHSWRKEGEATVDPETIDYMGYIFSFNFSQHKMYVETIQISIHRKPLTCWLARHRSTLLQALFLSHFSLSNTFSYSYVSVVSNSLSSLFFFPPLTTLQLFYWWHLLQVFTASHCILSHSHLRLFLSLFCL